jgi:hypothetical protein
MSPTFDVGTSDYGLTSISTRINEVCVAEEFDVSIPYLWGKSSTANLLVSLRAAARLAYLPLLPTVMAPAGGDEAARTEAVKLRKEARSERLRMSYID